MKPASLTDAGASEWVITDDPVRLRPWGEEVAYMLPAPEDAPVVIGASNSCWLQLENAAGHLSRRHALLRHAGGGWILEDLESKNGIKVDGARRDSVRLEAGIEIQLGSATLIVESGRSIALTRLLARLVGYRQGGRPTIDRALRAIRLAVTHRAPLVLCHEGVETPSELMWIAREIHRLVLGDRPFVTCDARRAESDAVGRAAANHWHMRDAVRAAENGSVCILASRPPPDLERLAPAWCDPQSRVAVFVCSDEAAARFGSTVVPIPRLADRLDELPQMIFELAREASEQLGLAAEPLSQPDVEWLIEHEVVSFPQLATAVRRVLVIRRTANLNRAAALLDVARHTLSDWADRHGLPQ